MIALNFGCGTNKLEGWQNFDAEIDISKPLPFPNNHADCILAEHVVEHIEYYAALSFFKECRRVLKHGGIVRIAVPSIEQIWKFGDQDYFDFAGKWAPSKDARGAMHAMMFAHGHKTAWTDTLLEASLFYAGFDKVRLCEPLWSDHKHLRNIEGHGRVIGDAFNEIETIVCEGS